jgi:hypothetical protein
MRPIGSFREGDSNVQKIRDIDFQRDQVSSNYPVQGLPIPYQLPDTEFARITSIVGNGVSIKYNIELVRFDPSTASVSWSVIEDLGTKLYAYPDDPRKWYFVGDIISVQVTSGLYHQKIWQIVSGGRTRVPGIIKGNTAIGVNQNKWRYSIAPVRKTVADSIDPSGYYYFEEAAEYSAVNAYNSIEYINSATGIQGNGIDVDGLTGTSFEIQPAPTNTIVTMWRELIYINGDPTLENWFEFSNAVDGDRLPDDQNCYNCSCDAADFAVFGSFGGVSTVGDVHMSELDNIEFRPSSRTEYVEGGGQYGYYYSFAAGTSPIAEIRFRWNGDGTWDNIYIMIQSYTNGVTGHTFTPFNDPALLEAFPASGSCPAWTGIAIGTLSWYWTGDTGEPVGEFGINSMAGTCDPCTGYTDGGVVV